jgi:hypothetical protein
MTFDPAAYSSLLCGTFEYSVASGEAAFGYTLRGTGPELHFTERITLPVPDVQPSGGVCAAATEVLRLAHLVAGVSYAKSAGVASVEFATGPIAPGGLSLLEGVYRDGMAEFAYTNDRPEVLDTDLVADVADSPASIVLTGDRRRPLVACGGGKDSIVTIETLRRAGYDPVSFVVNPNDITTSVVERSRTTLLAVTRTLDPLLFELNATGAYNGHVPVTAINSLLGVAVSLLHGLGPVVMSNESSASAPNLHWHGHDINHQWSKGIGAERLIRTALADCFGANASLYFSLLRHLNELSITALFARIADYDDVVTSCNRAFTITKKTGKRWCRDCPKCRFVFLALACFMPADRVLAIFGADMLRDDAQVDGYRELLGITAFKPFECVGELDESVAAVGHLSQVPEWKDASVITVLNDEIATSGRPVPALQTVLGERGPSLAPADYLAALDALA